MTQTLCPACGQPIPDGQMSCACGAPTPRIYPSQGRTVLLSWIATVGGMAGLLWLAATYLR